MAPEPASDRTSVALGAVRQTSRRITAAGQVYAHLRREIITGRLVPRHQLSEVELANRYGVSRTPIRLALGRLEDDGLVDIYPQYGTFVTPIRPADIYASQFIRQSLECAALPMAIERLDEDDAARLRTLIDVQRQLISQDYARFAEADEAMHKILMTIAGHGAAWHAVEDAKLQHDRVRYLSVRNPMKRESVLAEHQAIIEGVIARDPKAAVDALLSHLGKIFATVERSMQEHPEYFDSDEGVSALEFSTEALSA